MHKLISIPKFCTVNGADFEAHAEAASKNEALMSALRAKAEGFMTKECPAVTKRNTKADSGDIHDYASMGPYWWPNPNTESGLPYVRRDGEVNPETKEVYSFPFTAVDTLALAAYYFDDDKYAGRAEEFVRVWYLNEDTKMNPNMNYAQFVPGVCRGRGIGLIDCAVSYNFFNAMALLEAMGNISEDVISGVRAWYNEFLDWMLTSEIGLEEDMSPNNHGNWYDAQVIATAMYLGRKTLAKRTLNLNYERRLLKQIEPNGAMPLELARTRGMGYSIYNLNAIFNIANMSRIAPCDIDYWRVERGEGDIAIKCAVDYLIPYILDFSTFPYKQITEFKAEGNSEVAKIFATMAKIYPEEENYARLAEKYTEPNMLWQLKPI